MVPDGGNIKSLPPKYWNIRKYNKAYYKNWVEWDVIMNRFGFELVKGGYVSFSINWNLSPTRSFYGIYQKVKDVK